MPRLVLTMAALTGLAVFRVGRLVLGILGLWYTFGPVWGPVSAILGAIALVVFRFSWLIRLGIVFGAVSLLGCSWILGVLLAVPRLVLMLPGLISMLLARWRHPLPVWQSAHVTHP